MTIILQGTDSGQIVTQGYGPGNATARGCVHVDDEVAHLIEIGDLAARVEIGDEPC